MAGMETVRKGRDHRPPCNSKKKTSDMPSVDDFMEQYINSNLSSGKPPKPSMNTLRHFIPLLVMMLYPAEEQGNKMKVKGMWDKKPDGWPADVPFQDPNNARRDPDNPEKKPSRPALATLINMFNVLVKQYIVYKSNPSTEIAAAVASVSTAPFSPESVSCMSPSPCIVTIDECRPSILDQIARKLQQIKIDEEKTSILESVNGTNTINEYQDYLLNKFNQYGREPKFFHLAHNLEYMLDCIIECPEKITPQDWENWRNITSQMKQDDTLKINTKQEMMKKDIDVIGKTMNELNSKQIRETAVNVIKELQARGLLQIRKDDPLQTIDVSSISEIGMKPSSFGQDMDDSSNYASFVLKDNKSGASFPLESGSYAKTGCISTEKSAVESVVEVPDSLTRVLQVAGINADDPGVSVDPDNTTCEEQITESATFSLDDYYNMEQLLNEELDSPGPNLQFVDTVPMDEGILGYENIALQSDALENDPMLSSEPITVNLPKFNEEEVPSAIITVTVGPSGSGEYIFSIDPGPDDNSSELGLPIHEEMET